MRTRSLEQLSTVKKRMKKTTINWLETFTKKDNWTLSASAVDLFHLNWNSCIAVIYLLLVNIEQVSETCINLYLNLNKFFFSPVFELLQAWKFWMDYDSLETICGCSSNFEKSFFFTLQINLFEILLIQTNFGL